MLMRGQHEKSFHKGLWNTFFGYADDMIVHHDLLREDTHFISKPFTGKALSRSLRKSLNASSK